MENNDVDKMIKKDLAANPPGLEIDIRREIMSRIEAYEGKKDGRKNIGIWILSLFVCFAGLFSIILIEGLLFHYEGLFYRLNVNMDVVKFGLQGVFLVCVLISLTVMISQVKPAKHLRRFMFLASF